MDYNFGYDSNGYEIDESTVEELARIADETLEEQVTDWNVSISRDSFKEGYYLTGTAFGADLHYDMWLSFDTANYDISAFSNPDFTGSMCDYSSDSENAYATVDIHLAIDNDDIKVTSTDVECFTNMFNTRYNYDESESKHFFEKYDKDKLCAHIIKSLKPAVYEVRTVVSNL